MRRSFQAVPCKSLDVGQCWFDVVVGVVAGTTRLFGDRLGGAVGTSNVLDVRDGCGSVVGVGPGWLNVAVRSITEWLIARSAAATQGNGGTRLRDELAVSVG